MATIRKLITGALSRLNAASANSPPTAEDIDVGLAAFNSLIDSLSNNILNIYTTRPYRFPMVAGVGDYTLGPTGDWVLERPMRIETAVLIAYPTTNDEGDITANNNTMFLPLDRINYAEYSSIVVRKLQTTWPTVVYDSGTYPNRLLRFWPIPQQTLAVELWLWEPLATYDSIDEELNLPPGYERYLTLKLAMELAPEFGKTVTDTLMATLAEAESAVKTINQMTTVSQASNAAVSLTRRAPGMARSHGVSNRIPRTF